MRFVVLKRALGNVPGLNSDMSKGRGLGSEVRDPIIHLDALILTTHDLKIYRKLKKHHLDVASDLTAFFSKLNVITDLI